MPHAGARLRLRIVVAAAALALAAGGCARDGAARPGANVLLVTLDTVRADRVGCYGGAVATPALDRLAREGVRFAQASSPAPLTLPAHASLLSGLLPPAHGLRNNGAGAFPADRPTLATALAARGYRTAAFLGAFVLDRRFGLDRGFATYDDEIERGPDTAPSLEAERRGDRVVDRALAWLERQGEEDERPFFLWVHLYDAHAPYAPPPPFRERHAGRPYDGEVSFADAQVGRLLAALDRRGLAGDTVVAVAADHGEALGEHGELTHGFFLYEPTLHVPLLLRAPGNFRGGTVVETPVGLADLAPTLSGLVEGGLAVAAPAGLAGRDLSAALLAGEEPAAADLYAETHYPEVFGWSRLAALRRREVKYVDAPRPELYDLRRDPGEARNLAGKEDLQGFADRIAELERQGIAPAPAPAPDAETAAKLASLGYATAARRGRGRDAAAIEPRGADPKDRIALFRRYERAHNGLRAGHLAEATATLSQLVAADPANPVFRGELAQAYRAAGDLARALPLYRAAVAAAPHDSQGWYDLASALQEAGESGEAVVVTREALRLDPRQPEAHNALGVALLAEGDAAAARRAFVRAAELDPRNAPALNNLGNALRAAGRLDEAEDAYRRALAAAPGYGEALNGLGTLAVARDRPADALPLFERALRLAPAQHEIRLNRGIALDLLGRRAAASAAYRDFLAAAADTPELAEQRSAARRLLARLAGPAAGAAPGGR
ncbi:MAG TPA: sulfatase-like hydrolase/transferase [Thermoanaerobaculia bacterium]